MIWEVDEDCDGAVHWDEFQRMYHRCRSDKTGQEPRRLFNVTEFIMNDKDFSGRVSLEEAMQILYLRYGRGLLDAQLQDIFGTSDLNSGKTLCLTEFLDSLHASQVFLKILILWSLILPQVKQLHNRNSSRLQKSNED